MTSNESLDDHLEPPQSVMDVPVYSDAAIRESLSIGMRIATARAAGHIANHGTREQVIALNEAIKEIRLMRRDGDANG